MTALRGYIPAGAIGDIDYVPADKLWPAQHHADEDSFYQWGPEPPADFAVNHEAAA
jgi:hypothetical protein